MPRDEVFEAIFECWLASEYSTSAAGALTTTERGRINKAAAEIRKVGGTADDVRVRWEAARAKWPNLTLTPQAIVGNWSTLLAPVTRPRASGAWKPR